MILCRVYLSCLIMYLSVRLILFDLSIFSGNVWLCYHLSDWFYVRSICLVWLCTRLSVSAYVWSVCLTCLIMSDYVHVCLSLCMVWLVWLCTWLPVRLSLIFCLVCLSVFSDNVKFCTRLSFFHFYPVCQSCLIMSDYASQSGLCLSHMMSDPSVSSEISECIRPSVTISSADIAVWSMILNVLLAVFGAMRVVSALSRWRV